MGVIIQYHTHAVINIVETHSNTGVVHMHDQTEVFKTYPNRDFPSPRKTPPLNENFALKFALTFTPKQAFLDENFWWSLKIDP